MKVKEQLQFLLEKQPLFSPQFFNFSNYQLEGPLKAKTWWHNLYRVLFMKRFTTRTGTKLI